MRTISYTAKERRAANQVWNAIILIHCFWLLKQGI